jgi:hypothetical protein
MIAVVAVGIRPPIDLLGRRLQANGVFAGDAHYAGNRRGWQTDDKNCRENRRGWVLCALSKHMGLLHRC